MSAEGEVILEVADYREDAARIGENLDVMPLKSEVENAGGDKHPSEAGGFGKHDGFPNTNGSNESYPEGSEVNQASGDAINGTEEYEQGTFSEPSKDSSRIYEVHHPRNETSEPSVEEPYRHVDSDTNGVEAGKITEIHVPEGLLAKEIETEDVNKEVPVRVVEPNIERETGIGKNDEATDMTKHEEQEVITYRGRGLLEEGYGGNFPRDDLKTENVAQTEELKEKDSSVFVKESMGAEGDGSENVVLHNGQITENNTIAEEGYEVDDRVEGTAEPMISEVSFPEEKIDEEVPIEGDNVTNITRSEEVISDITNVKDDSVDNLPSVDVSVTEDEILDKEITKTIDDDAGPIDFRDDEEEVRERVLATTETATEERALPVPDEFSNGDSVSHPKSEQQWQEPEGSDINETANASEAASTDAIGEITDRVAIEQENASMDSKVDTETVSGNLISESYTESAEEVNESKEEAPSNVTASNEPDIVGEEDTSSGLTLSEHQSTKEYEEVSAGLGEVVAEKPLEVSSEQADIIHRGEDYTEAYSASDGVRETQKEVTEEMARETDDVSDPIETETPIVADSLEDSPQHETREILPEEESLTETSALSSEQKYLEENVMEEGNNNMKEVTRPENASEEQPSDVTEASSEAKVESAITDAADELSEAQTANVAEALPEEKLDIDQRSAELDTETSLAVPVDSSIGDQPASDEATKYEETSATEAVDPENEIQEEVAEGELPRELDEVPNQEEVLEETETSPTDATTEKLEQLETEAGEKAAVDAEEVPSIDNDQLASNEATKYEETSATEAVDPENEIREEVAEGELSRELDEVPNQEEVLEETETSAADATTEKLEQLETEAGEKAAVDAEVSSIDNDQLASNEATKYEETSATEAVDPESEIREEVADGELSQDLDEVPNQEEVLEETETSAGEAANEKLEQLETEAGEQAAVDAEFSSIDNDQLASNEATKYEETSATEAVDPENEIREEVAEGELSQDLDEVPNQEVLEETETSAGEVKSEKLEQLETEAGEKAAVDAEVPSIDYDRLASNEAPKYKESSAAEEATESETLEEKILTKGYDDDSEEQIGKDEEPARAEDLSVLAVTTRDATLIPETTMQDNFEESETNVHAGMLQITADQTDVAVTEATVVSTETANVYDSAIDESTGTAVELETDQKQGVPTNDLTRQDDTEIDKQTEDTSDVMFSETTDDITSKIEEYNSFGVANANLVSDEVSVNPVEESTIFPDEAVIKSEEISLDERGIVGSTECTDTSDSVQETKEDIVQTVDVQNGEHGIVNEPLNETGIAEEKSTEIVEKDLVDGTVSEEKVDAEEVASETKNIETRKFSFEEEHGADQIEEEKMEIIDSNDQKGEAVEHDTRGEIADVDDSQNSTIDASVEQTEEEMGVVDAERTQMSRNINTESFEEGSPAAENIELKDLPEEVQETEEIVDAEETNEEAVLSRSELVESAIVEESTIDQSLGTELIDTQELTQISRSIDAESIEERNPATEESKYSTEDVTKSEEIVDTKETSVEAALVESTVAEEGILDQSIGTEIPHERESSSVQLEESEAKDVEVPLGEVMDSFSKKQEIESEEREPDKEISHTEQRDLASEVETTQILHVVDDVDITSRTFTANTQEPSTVEGDVKEVESKNQEDDSFGVVNTDLRASEVPENPIEDSVISEEPAISQGQVGSSLLDDNIDEDERGTVGSSEYIDVTDSAQEIKEDIVQTEGVQNSESGIIDEIPVGIGITEDKDSTDIVEKDQIDGIESEEKFGVGGVASEPENIDSREVEQHEQLVGESATVLLETPEREPSFEVEQGKEVIASDQTEVADQVEEERKEILESGDQNSEPMEYSNHGETADMDDRQTSINEALAGLPEGEKAAVEVKSDLVSGTETGIIDAEPTQTSRNIDVERFEERNSATENTDDLGKEVIVSEEIVDAKETSEEAAVVHSELFESAIVEEGILHQNLGTEISHERESSLVPSKENEIKDWEAPLGEMSESFLEKQEMNIEERDLLASEVETTRTAETGEFSTSEGIHGLPNEAGQQESARGILAEEVAMVEEEEITSKDAETDRFIQEDESSRQEAEISIEADEDEPNKDGELKDVDEVDTESSAITEEKVATAAPATGTVNLENMDSNTVADNSFVEEIEGEKTDTNLSNEIAREVESDAAGADIPFSERTIKDTQPNISGETLDAENAGADALVEDVASKEEELVDLEGHGAVATEQRELVNPMEVSDETTLPDAPNETVTSFQTQLTEDSYEQDSAKITEENKVDIEGETADGSTIEFYRENDNTDLEADKLTSDIPAIAVNAGIERSTDEQATTSSDNGELEQIQSQEPPEAEAGGDEVNQALQNEVETKEEGSIEEASDQISASDASVLDFVQEKEVHELVASEDDQTIRTIQEASGYTDVDRAVVAEEEAGIVKTAAEDVESASIEESTLLENVSANEVESVVQPTQQTDISQDEADTSTVKYALGDTDFGSVVQTEEILTGDSVKIKEVLSEDEGESINGAIREVIPITSDAQPTVSSEILDGENVGEEKSAAVLVEDDDSKEEGTDAGIGETSQEISVEAAGTDVPNETVTTTSQTVQTDDLYEQESADDSKLEFSQENERDAQEKTSDEQPSQVLMGNQDLAVDTLTGDVQETTENAEIDQISGLEERTTSAMVGEVEQTQSRELSTSEETFLQANGMDSSSPPEAEIGLNEVETKEEVTVEEAPLSAVIPSDGASNQTPALSTGIPEDVQEIETREVETLELDDEGRKKVEQEDIAEKVEQEFTSNEERTVSGESLEDTISSDQLTQSMEQESEGGENFGEFIKDVNTNVDGVAAVDAEEGIKPVQHDDVNEERLVEPIPHEDAVVEETQDVKPALVGESIAGVLQEESTFIHVSEKDAENEQVQSVATNEAWSTGNECVLQTEVSQDVSDPSAQKFVDKERDIQATEEITPPELADRDFESEVPRKEVSKEVDASEIEEFELVDAGVSADEVREDNGDAAGITKDAVEMYEDKTSASATVVDAKTTISYGKEEAADVGGGVDGASVEGIPKTSDSSYAVQENEEVFADEIEHRKEDASLDISQRAMTDLEDVDVKETVADIPATSGTVSDLPQGSVDAFTAASTADEAVAEKIAVLGNTDEKIHEENTSLAVQSEEMVADKSWVSTESAEVKKHEESRTLDFTSAQADQETKNEIDSGETLSDGYVADKADYGLESEAVEIAGVEPSIKEKEEKVFDEGQTLSENSSGEKDEYEHVAAAEDEAPVLSDANGSAEGMVDPTPLEEAKGQTIDGVEDVQTDAKSETPIPNVQGSSEDIFEADVARTIEESKGINQVIVPKEDASTAYTDAGQPRDASLAKEFAADSPGTTELGLPPAEAPGKEFQGEKSLPELSAGIIKPEENEEHEDDDDHEHVEHPEAALLIAESSREGVDAKSHKKSHNLLSGMSSKVKSSISKVKKVITGKSSSPKQKGSE